MGTARARIHRRQLATIVLVACALTPVFNILTAGATWREAFQGVIDAVLVSLAVGGYLLFLRDGRRCARGSAGSASGATWPSAAPSSWRCSW